MFWHTIYYFPWIEHSLILENIDTENTNLFLQSFDMSGTDKTRSSAWPQQLENVRSGNDGLSGELQSVNALNRALTATYALMQHSLWLSSDLLQYIAALLWHIKPYEFHQLFRMSSSIKKPSYNVDFRFWIYLIC